MSVKPRTWILDSTQGFTRLLCTQDKKIIYCDADIMSPKPHYGEIYQAKVVKAFSNSPIAFLDLGEGLEAIFPMTERNFPRPVEGEMVSVQIAREADPREDKLAMTTRSIEIQVGPLLWMNYESDLKFSKKIGAQKRTHLDALLPDAVGILVRSNVELFSDKEIRGCYNVIPEITRAQGFALESEGYYPGSPLDNKRSRISGSQPKPSLGSPSFRDDVSVFIQNILNQSTPRDQILVDSLNLYNQFSKTIESHPYKPRLIHERVKTFDENLEEVWSQMFETHVPISGGGEVIIEKTHAFTSIDINATSTNLPKAAFLKKAIEVIFEEIRKRDLAGIILIDLPFSPKDQGDILSFGKKEAQLDLNPPQIHGITKLGILELTRKMRRMSLPERIQLWGNGGR